MLAAVLAFALSAPAAPPAAPPVGRVEGRGARVDDVRALPAGIGALVVRGPLRVEVVAADDVADVGEPRAVVSAEPNLQPLVVLSARDGVLEVVAAGDPVSPAGIVVTLQMPPPSTVSAWGTARIATPVAGVARVETSGAARVRLSGNPTRLAIVARGASAIDASGVVVDDVTVEVGGAVEVEVAARKLLSVAGGGVGRVRYRGDPQLQTKVAPTVKVTRSRS